MNEIIEIASSKCAQAVSEVIIQSGMRSLNLKSGFTLNDEYYEIQIKVEKTKP